MNYIDLSRRFRDLTESELEAPELLASLNDATWAAAAGMSAGWAELLQHPRVLILAEAGSGKTAEMQGQAARLSAEGKRAFFVALEALDREPLAEILSCSDNRDLDAWKAEGQAPAWFFLDAVDELKLTQGKLDRALNRLANAIDGHLHRAHCVISCRPSDFRRSVDLTTVQAKLPVTSSQPSPQSLSNDAFLAALCKQEHGREPKKRTKHGDGPRIVVLLPLSEDQIVAFAGSLGVADTAKLIEEIRRRNAWTFARRPLDLINLVASWKADKRLGTRAEQHAANVTAKLTDDPDRPDHGVLTADRARSGAERLALALALTRTRTIQSPEQALSMESAEGVLDPAEILADWTPKERQTLLRRALFDPATYGRVRFHHRSVQEYLAARKLKELRERGMPVKNLHRLLFAELYSVLLVKPSMQAIAAWLALWDDDVRRELMEREPETLLSMGDPESLSIGDRAQLLRTFFKTYGEGGWRGFDIPINEVRRLADPALAGVVRELWDARPASPDVTELLLEIICQGPIGECAGIARAAAFDVNQPNELRVTAIRALLACGDLVSAREITDSILGKPEIWPDRIARTAAGILFPNALNTCQLIVLLKRTPEPKEDGGGFSWVMRRIVESIEPTAEVAVELRDTLTDLIWKGRHEDQEWYRPRGSFNYLAPALARLCERQLEGSAALRTPDDRLIWACVVANRFGDDEIGGRSQARDLKKHFETRVDHREAAFWSEIRLRSELEPVPNAQKQLIRAEQGSLLVHLKTDDRPWLLEASRRWPNPTDRRVALHALLRLWNPQRSDQGELDELRAAIGDDMELAEALRQRSTPFEPNPEHEKWEQEARQQELERERDKSETRAKWLQWKDQLLANPDAAFSGEELPVTTNNLYRWFESRRGGTFIHYNAWDENALRAAFGDDIARRAARAFQEVWRAHRPTLKSQRPPGDRERTLWIWCEGLTGLAAEAMNPGWATRLTPDEARIATTYATIELNEFPSWLRDVTATHPMAVDEVIGGELTAELTRDQGQSYLPTLQNLSQADISIKRLLAYRLLNWLPNWPLTFQDEKCSNQSAHHLDESLGILAEVTEDQNRTAIAAECERRFSGSPKGPLAETWLRWLFRFNPERATCVLEEVLTSVPEPERSTYAVATFANLFGSRGTLLVFPDNGNGPRAATLARLVRCAYAHVRPAEDKEHEGAYSPDLRDHAERARNFLLYTLLDTSGPEAQKVVHDLAVDPIFAHFPDRLRLLARRRAANDAEGPALSTEDVIALEKRLEAPPHDRDGLFAVMIDRLADLAHDLAHHEFTNRRTLQTIKDETEMQRNLARSLLDTAKGAYKVSREEEVADRKRTDIQLATTHGDQKAVIEVKIADGRWSLTQLENALHNQLVGQYLRHNMCKAGCLLLVYNGTKKYWSCPRTRKRLKFSEVVEHLRFLASGIESEMNYEVLLRVFPLDLTEPPMKSAR